MNVISRLKLLLDLQSAVGKLQKALSNYKKDDPMNLSFLQSLKSRTVWVAAAGVAFNIYNTYHNVLPPNMTAIADAAIGLLTVVFRIFPKQGTTL